MHALRSAHCLNSESTIHDQAGSAATPPARPPVRPPYHQQRPPAAAAASNRTPIINYKYSALHIVLQSDFHRKYVWSYLLVTDRSRWAGQCTLCDRRTSGCQGRGDSER